jgi:hypothetical protein
VSRPLPPLPHINVHSSSGHLVYFPPHHLVLSLQQTAEPLTRRCGSGILLVLVWMSKDTSGWRFCFAAAIRHQCLLRSHPCPPRMHIALPRPLVGCTVHGLCAGMAAAIFEPVHRFVRRAGHLSTLPCYLLTGIRHQSDDPADRGR